MRRLFRIVFCLWFAALMLFSPNNSFGRNPSVMTANHLAYQKKDKPTFHDDDGGGLSFEEDKPRIDRFAEGMKSNKSAIAYIIAYGGMVSYKNEAAIRLRCIRNYLVKAHGISPSRLKLIDGGYRVEVSVQLFLVKPDDLKPTAYGIVNREAVKMKKAPKYPCGKVMSNVSKVQVGQVSPE